MREHAAIPRFFPVATLPACVLPSDRQWPHANVLVVETETTMFFRLLPWEYAIRNLFRRPLRTGLTFVGLTTVIVLIFVVGFSSCILTRYFLPPTKFSLLDSGRQDAYR